MPHATMYFEDAPDGLIDFRIDWHGPVIDRSSEAHKTALMVYNFLDQHASQKLANTRVDPAPTDAIQNGHDNEFSQPAIYIPQKPSLLVPL